MQHSKSLPTVLLSLRYRSRWIAGFLAVGFAFQACSPSTPPPQLNQLALPTQNCTSLDMNLHAMQPKHVRSLLTCLNADGRIAPLVKLADDLTDDEMKPLLEVYNQSIGGAGHRLEENIALFERAQAAHLLNPFFKNLAILLDSDLIQNLGVSILSDMHDDERENLRKGALSVAQKKQVDGLLLLGSQMLASPRAQTAAQALAVVSGDATTRQNVGSETASLIHAMAINGELKRALISVEDPQLTQMLQSNPDEAGKLTRFTQWLAENPAVVDQRAGRLARMVTFLNRPLKCFVDPKQGTSTDIPNVLDFYMSENARLVHEGSSSEYADQVKNRLLLSVAMSNCDLSDSDRLQMQDLFGELNDIAEAGVDDGKSLMCSKFYDYKRVQDLKTVMASPSMIPAFRILSRMNVSGALQPTVELMLADIPTSTWAPGQSSLQQFRQAGGLDGALGWLARWTDLSQKTSNSSFSRVVDSLVKTWSASNEGFGGLLQNAILISSQTARTPLQDAMVTALSDAPRFNSAWKSAALILAKPTAQAGLHTLADMARDGRLTGLINFMVAYQASGGNLPPMGNAVSVGPVTNYTLVPVPGFHNSKETQHYLECQKVTGPLFDPTDTVGQRMLDAVGCLNSTQEFPAVLRATQTLAQDGKLGALRDVVSHGLLNPSYIPGAKEELAAAARSGLTHATLDFLRVGDSAGEFKNIENVLAQMLSDSTRRTAPLQCVAALLKEPSGAYGMSKVLDLAAAKNEAPYLQMDHHFVMKLGTQEAGVRDQAWNLAKGEMNQRDFDKQFARAKNEFENRSFDSTYYSRTVLYPKLSDDQIVQFLSQLGKDLLKDRNLEEMILALQDLSDWNQTGQLDINKFLNGAVGTYRGIIFHDPDGTPEVRIVSVMDQMDILVRSTDVSMAKNMPVIGISHMSTYYQVQVAEADNLVFTLEKLKTLANMGSLYTTIFETEKHFTLQNAVDNFYVLVDYAKTGELKVFQRIYQGLYRATPPERRHLYDQYKNNISLIHRPMDIAFFGRLEPILQQLREQGKLKVVVDAIFHLAKVVKPEDFPRVREMIDTLVNQRMAPNGPTYLEYILIQLKNQNVTNPNDFTKIVSQFYEALPVADRLIEHGGPFVGAASEAIKAPALFKRVVDSAFKDVVVPNSDLRNLTSHFLKMPAADQGLIRHLVGQLTDPNMIPLDAVPKLGTLLAETYSARPNDINAALDGWTTWRDRAAQKNLVWTDLGQQWLRNPPPPAPGVKALTIHLLDDAATQATLIEISADLAARGQLSPMIHDILGAGHVEEAIRLLTDGFQFSKANPKGTVAVPPVPLRVIH